MKPNFALSLSFEGIRLLHRAPDGWRQVGEVAVDAEDMAAQLAALRSTATALEPSGLRSKLLIPNDQIKYMTIDTAGLSDQARREQAEVALDGATPYAVEDLVFDISNDGPRTHIAAVARETLAEAEAFATEHRFHPVSFAAQSDDHDFTGEAFFGPTDSAPKWLEPGDSVERDKGPFVILGDVELPPEDTSPPKGDAAAEAENPGKADDVTADASQEGDSTLDAPAAWPHMAVPILIQGRSPETRSCHLWSACFLMSANNGLLFVLVNSRDQVSRRINIDASVESMIYANNRGLRTSA